MYNSFDSLAETQMENAGVGGVGGGFTPGNAYTGQSKGHQRIQPVDPVSPIPSELPPTIQEWGNSVNKRFNGIETRLQNLETVIPTLATKSDIAIMATKIETAEMKSEMNAGFSRLEQMIQKR
jgi:hypothetical protein